MNSTWVDTSLSVNLNVNPLRLFDETPKRELERNTVDLGRKLSVKEEEEGSVLAEELNRVNAENKKLIEMLTVMSENYNALQSQVMDLMSKNPRKEITTSRKRKAESNNDSNKNVINGNTESSSSDEDLCKYPREEINTKVSRIYVRTNASDTSLVVKDGYQWRKYGQKVTKDNPSPRAYFKCSFSPTCSVKKKVQRSIEDQSTLVASYEGEHNHPRPSRAEAAMVSSQVVTPGSVPCLAPVSSSSSALTLDLTKPGSCDDANKSSREIQLSAFQQFLVDQMGSSLAKDPSFAAALVAAISGRIFEQGSTEKW
ncbi:hypothetical protein HHK36_006374 [Tetracentron sinense]|uniref:WRKY domain-containing protein n=1 Tax=Tetracentron sinense TaxID=13715 RepID=A0A834ZIV3_TETSI|nr:hypothetical protein HHK36_006374 [Tetracentron sinense]